MLQPYRTVLPVTNANLIAFRMYYNYYRRGELVTNRLGVFARTYVNKTIRKAILDAKEACGDRSQSFEYAARVEREIHKMVESEIDYVEHGGYDYEPDFDISEHLIEMIDANLKYNYPTRAELEERRYD